ncbi:MAG: ABC transporter ATP-binding protein [Caldilineaceae bacterium]
MADDIVLDVQGLTKHYGKFVAVDNLNLRINRGEIFGLLGPNGAGKTTTILMLLGLTEPTSGSVRVLGFDPTRQPLSVKARVGYLPDAVGFYDELTARENLAYIARLNGLPRKEANSRIEAAIARMGLSDVLDKQVRTFSRGMRQRLGVADLLIKRPQLIIMDEPTLGLDPEAARQFLQLIVELRDEGITLMLSSHLLHQVQAVCNQVGLFSKGKMELVGAVPELAQQVLGGGYRIHVQAQGAMSNGKGAGALVEALRQVPGVQEVQRTGDERYLIVGKGDLRAEAAAAVVNAGDACMGWTWKRPAWTRFTAVTFRR